MTLALLQALPEAGGALAADGTAIAVLVGVFAVLLALGVRVAFAGSNPSSRAPSPSGHRMGKLASSSFSTWGCRARYLTKSIAA